MALARVCERARSVPSLVLLDAEGALVSTDGVSLLRKHQRAFPWSVAPPPQLPHIHPNLDRLLRRSPVDPGAAHDLPRYKAQPLMGRRPWGRVA